MRAVDPPIKPGVEDDFDLSNFDEDFRKMSARDSCVTPGMSYESSVMSASVDDRELFKGFSYVAEDLVHHANTFDLVSCLFVLWWPRFFVCNIVHVYIQFEIIVLKIIGFYFYL